MNIKFLIRISAIACFLFALPMIVQAQATRTWVSGVGDDANPCSRTAPCKTFAGTISKTARNGEINCLDPAGFGAVTITKSITIDCKPTLGGLLASGQNGILINITDPTDTAKTVRLRGLEINGFSTGFSGVRILAADRVYVEDSVIDGFATAGISVANTSNIYISVKNTKIRNNNIGIDVQPTVGTLTTSVALETSALEGNATGFSVIGNGKAVFQNSSVKGNTGTGIYARKADVSVVDTVVSYNNIGIQSDTPAVVKLNRATVANNTTGLATSTGQIISFKNNLIYGNTTDGVPTLSLDLQ